MAKDILLEIGLEEVPAKFLPNAIEQLKTAAVNKFEAARIAYSKVETYATPRRLVLIVREAAELQNDKRSENKGPSVKVAYDAEGNPTKAAQGFARGQGVDTSQLITKEGYVYAIVEEVGRPVQEILSSILPEIILGLSFPKNMRWGQLDLKFVRPIRWLVAMFGSEIISFEVAGIPSGYITRGHRFLGSDEIIINSTSEYQSKLSDNYCIVDQNIRRDMILRQIEELAVNHRGSVNVDNSLLEEVTYLVEYPTALCGQFDEKYLKLPPEAIITPMREHQRYFPVTGANGELLPLFITVRNGGSEYLDVVRHGNEKVLKARLADAAFFFNEDKKVSMHDRVQRLKTIVYQEGLGTLYDKTQRLVETIKLLSGMLGIGDVENCERSAYLAKADLTTGMVYEFSELQGVMGRYYALLDGEAKIVAQAIFEHYQPRFAGDELPKSSVGLLLSIADKLDNIVATFSRGLVPTGSQDPYALRRQALGIVNMVIAAKYDFSIIAVAEKIMDLLHITDESIRQRITGDIREFIRLRMKNVLTEEGISYDVIDAILDAGIDNIYDAWLRAKMVENEKGKDSVKRAVQAFTRVANLAKNAGDNAIDPSLFVNDVEVVLYDSYKEAMNKIKVFAEEKSYIDVYKTMADMTEPIDNFFGAVMVMVEDAAVRQNRLALLKGIAGLSEGIIDLSKIATL